MPRIRLRGKAIFYFLFINIVVLVLFNVLRWNNKVSLRKLTVNSSMKQFIQKLVPKQKNVLTFEIGRPKPEGNPSVCRFTQSDGLELLAENYLYPGDNPDEKKCPETTAAICVIRGSLGSVQINCEHNPCGATVKVGSLIKETGQIQWEDVNSSKLEKFIQELVLRNIDVMYPFFYLKCGNMGKQTPTQPTQLVSLPFAVTTNTSQPTKKDINVNILILNSVSRRHFYRSLPRTIAAFRNINLNPKSTSNVLDFELYQALSAAPSEFLLGLVTGVNNKSQSTTGKTMLTHFKQAGYQTLWQDDECWKSDMGFGRYFGIHHSTVKNNLEILKVKLKSDDIDSLGLTHSSCLNIDENVKETGNKLVNDQICINGRLQDDHFLDYIMQSLSEINNKPSLRPLFSLTSLSLGKEESGRRIQILDSSLANFVKKMAADKNTITVLISDHGNTFDIFPVHTMEGQYEQHNPFLFMVLPTFVAWRLGESKKKNLINNQLKLISISDIHAMALSFVETRKSSNESHSQGLFTEIDSNRNCDQLYLSSSALCICDGWSSKQQPNTFHYIIAEFALAQLNNMIAHQYTNQKVKEAPFVTCERLKGVSLGNITQKRIKNGYIVTQIDIYVQRNELFRVNVKWHGDNNPAMEMALVNYERKHYNVDHTSCSTYIDRHLCICQNVFKDKDSDKNAPNWKYYGTVFGHRTKADNWHNHCLYILSRDYGVSTVFEAANMCNDVEYNVKMNFELENMRTPGEVPVNVTIPPKSVGFLTFVMPLHLTNPGTWEYEVDFSTKLI